MKIKILVLIFVIFIILFVCLVGFGIIFGFFVVVVKWIKKNELLKVVNYYIKEVFF